MQDRCTSAYVHAHCLIISAERVPTVPSASDMRSCHDSAFLWQVQYTVGKEAQKVVALGQCCFDTIKGHLCIAAAPSQSAFGCFMPARWSITPLTRTFALPS